MRGEHQRGGRGPDEAGGRGADHNGLGRGRRLTRGQTGRHQLLENWGGQS